MIRLTGFPRFYLYAFLFVLFLGLSLFLASRYFSAWNDSSAKLSDSAGETVVQLPPSRPAISSAKPVPLRLFYRRKEQVAGEIACLVEGKKLVAGHTEPEALALTALKELALGSEQGDPPAVPAQAIPMHIFFLSSGTAIINYNQSLRSGLPGGAEAETACIYAIVHTITVNFPSISSVRILIEGKEQETLGGHIGISKELQAKPILIQGYGDAEGGIYTEPLPP